MIENGFSSLKNLLFFDVKLKKYNKYFIDADCKNTTNVAVTYLETGSRSIRISLASGVISLIISGSDI